jgi:hypothetical protein
MKISFMEARFVADLIASNDFKSAVQQGKYSFEWRKMSI